MFGRDKTPALTKMAKRVSDAVAALPDERRPTTIAAVRDFVRGIRALGKIGDDVMSPVMDIALTLMRKASTRKMIGSSDEGDRDFEELKAGLSPELHTLIVETK